MPLLAGFIVISVLILLLSNSMSLMCKTVFYLASEPLNRALRLTWHEMCSQGARFESRHGHRLYWRALIAYPVELCIKHATSVPFQFLTYIFVIRNYIFRLMSCRYYSVFEQCRYVINIKPLFLTFIYWKDKSASRFQTVKVMHCIKNVHA